MKKVSAPQVVTTAEAIESPLPAEIQEALGELVGAAKEGLLALSVGVGLRVVHELLEAEVTEVVGPKGRWNPDRTASRHGHEDGSMTLGGRRVPVSRPRVRSVDGTELPVATYEYFADRDPLQWAVMNRMLAGVSTRKFARVGEPVGEAVKQTASAKNKSTVSEMFIEKTRTALGELMARRLDDMRLAVMMLDGLEIAGRVHVVALGVSTEGVKVPLGCGKDRQRTRRWRGRCWPIWSTGAWIPGRRSCSSWTAARHCDGRSRTCSERPRWCIAVIGTRNATCSIYCPSATAHGSWPGSVARGR